MKVRITGYDNKNLWYSDKIGDVFEVLDKYDADGYVVSDKQNGENGGYPGYGIIIRDCEIVTEPDTGLQCGCPSLEACAISSTCSGPSPENSNFKTGAYRDGDTGKLRYTRGMCPTVQTRYMEFLSRNRKQSDGKMRDFDNWKKGIPAKSYVESLGTHFWCVWEYFRSFKKPKLETGDIVDDLCAMRFNIDGLIHEILKSRHRKAQRIEREKS